MAPILAYWDIRALAEPIRYLLHYKSVDFEDKRYVDKEDWLNDKFNLNFDFPNLPYFIDGHLRLTQSLTILRHLARKYNLIGSNEDEIARVELAEQQILDLRASLFRTLTNPEFEKIKDEFIKGLPDQFKMWSTFLGDHKFLTGDKITYVDFIAYDMFDFHELISPTVFKELPNLKQYIKRFESLPQLQKYLESSADKKVPSFISKAISGSKGEKP